MRTIQEEEPLNQDVERFGDLLRAIGRIANLRDPLVGPSAAETEFSHTQIHVLMWLGVDGPLMMGELARRAGITEKTITGVVDRLEKAGVAARLRDAEDRRVVRVGLTDSGREMFKDLEATMRKRFAGFLSLLDRTERDTLFRILEKFLSRLTNVTADGKPEPSQP